MYQFDTNDIKEAQNAFQTTRCRNVEMPPHLHYSLEFFCVKKGCITVTVGKEERRMTAGQATLLLPFEPHSVVSEGETACFSVLFPPQLAEDFYGIIKDRTLQPAVCTLSPDVFDMCDRHLPEEGEAVGNIQAKALLYPLCEEFRHRCTFEKPAHSHRKSLFAKALQHIIQCIPAADISLASTAQALKVNPAYLSRTFRESSNIPFTTYVNMLRCYYAARILRERPELTVTEIALEAGFGSVRNFNREFRSMYGIAPNRLRACENENVK